MHVCVGIYAYCVVVRFIIVIAVIAYCRCCHIVQPLPLRPYQTHPIHTTHAHRSQRSRMVQTTTQNPLYISEIGAIISISTQPLSVVLIPVVGVVIVVDFCSLHFCGTDYLYF